MALKGNWMAISGKRWTVQDRDGNPIYLTEERWQHIVEADNHPEMADYEDHLQTTIQQGRRRQEPLNPRKYRYVQPFDNLPTGFNHIVGMCSLVLMSMSGVRRCRTTSLPRLF